MTTANAPDAIANAVEVFFRDHGVACLKLPSAADLSVDGRAMRIVIRSGAWDWTDYGGTATHREELNPGAVEFRATSIDPGSGR